MYQRGFHTALLPKRQRIPRQRRAMIPPDQRHIIAVNVHEPILVYLR